jgi:hypothetical protein
MCLNPSWLPASKGVVSSDLPSNSPRHRIPVQVLQSRCVARGASQVKQVLIKWSGLSTDLATWEDVESLQQQRCSRSFLLALLEGKQVPKQGGVSVPLMGYWGQLMLSTKFRSMDCPGGVTGPGSPT